MSFRFAAKHGMLHNSVRSMPDKVAAPECVRAPLLGQRTGAPLLTLAVMNTVDALNANVLESLPAQGAV